MILIAFWPYLLLQFGKLFLLSCYFTLQLLALTLFERALLPVEEQLFLDLFELSRVSLLGFVAALELIFDRLNLLLAFSQQLLVTSMLLDLSFSFAYSFLHLFQLLLPESLLASIEFTLGLCPDSLRVCLEGLHKAAHENRNNVSISVALSVQQNFEAIALNHKQRAVSPHKINHCAVLVGQLQHLCRLKQGQTSGIWLLVLGRHKANLVRLDSHRDCLVAGLSSG